MKVIIFEVEPHEAPMFERLRPQHEVTLVSEPLTIANAEGFSNVQVISTFIYSVLSSQILERLPFLKLIATRSTGYDHIDIGRCTERGITVCNVPTYGENTVAEHVFALLLAISHRLPEAMERAQRGSFSPTGLQGFDLAGKTIGVIGTGNIGSHVIRIALGFGMYVIAYDIAPNLGLAAKLGFRYAPFDDLLAVADVISLHLPSSPQTRSILSADAFRRMKTGAVIINTARGDLIDTPALIEALTSGKIAAAGLDVLPDEPLIREEAELISSIFHNEHDLRHLVANHVLLRMRNVVITPHSAFNTREAVARIAETTVENISAFVAGIPHNVVARH